MDRTNVVTAFLRRNNGTVLLLKRSSNVKTYQEHWAAVSGYLETKDPLLQAEREVRQETGLSSAQFQLQRRGYPLAVDDEPNDLRWRIHPFRLSTSPDVSITLDREHRTYQWCQPSRIDDLRTVPKLQACWERVRGE